MEGGVMRVVAAEIISIQRMVCTGCGAEANASCNCGVSYVPKAQRAAEAIKANPEKSDRAIAAEIGASPTTVGKAREQLSSGGQLEDAPRTGLDGKTRKSKPMKQVERVQQALDKAGVNSDVAVGPHGALYTVLREEEKSDRSIAGQTKADHKTVGAVRQELESAGEIPQLDKTAGADGKARKLPERKPPDPQEKEDRKTCVALYQKVLDAEREAAAQSLAGRFREHISAPYEILNSEDLAPPDVTGEELRLLAQMKDNLHRQVVEFEKMLDLFRWPITPSEESRKLANGMKHRAEALGCTMKKRGRQYEISGNGEGNLLTLDQVPEYLDHRRDEDEGKIYPQHRTVCGMTEPYEETNKEIRAAALAKNPDAKPFWLEH
jgi:hypothetical protein